MYGCKQNWTGTQCNVCDSDHYGSLCSVSCSNRHCDQTNGISRCDKITGRCDTGCEPGWTGPDCTKKCPNGRYGKGCKTSCASRHCLENSPCDHLTGEFVVGCDRGYETPDCTTKSGYGDVSLHLTGTAPVVLSIMLLLITWLASDLSPYAESR
ncbi:multiple epidermal growth factor-like domains protein 11 [Gigantopelta aegis]|uniref:multiple epidermal growth factor-like domains protein 11 n=1 Tax=Gigantopelta aegis TaxID=1735272 RepID=UPI001B88ADC3|nr:multiple epidermal growth factor-like domains protein 11 [Gigantopelta aegis]